MRAIRSDYVRDRIVYEKRAYFVQGEMFALQ